MAVGRSGGTDTGWNVMTDIIAGANWDVIEVVTVVGVATVDLDMEIVAVVDRETVVKVEGVELYMGEGTVIREAAERRGAGEGGVDKGVEVIGDRNVEGEKEEAVVG